MDGSRFDRLTREFGTRISRRSLIAKTLGLGGAAVVASQSASGAEAARRGFSGPKFPICTGPRCEAARCQVTADCPPCRCTGSQGIECNLCVADLGICQSYRFDCTGCCETVDDVGVCACNPV
jgi:hypothetical protein